MPKIDGYHQHTIRRGDTLAAIALQYGADYETILTLNSKSRVIQTVLVSPTPPTADLSQFAGQRLSVYPYVVAKEAESLAAFAVRTGFTTDELRDLNPFLKSLPDSGFLTAGAKIRVPPLAMPSSDNTLAEVKPEELPIFIGEPGDDETYSHREQADAYTCRIGDVFLQLPPEAIQVHRRNRPLENPTLRNSTPMISSIPTTQAEVVLTLELAGETEINGVEVPGLGGTVYHLDGLRALLAQFQLAPIVPIWNEYLNGVHDIWLVALGSLTISTVPQFPGRLRCQLHLREMTQTPFTGIADVEFGHRVVWPVYRWWLQRRVRELPTFSLKDQSGLSFELIRGADLDEGKPEKEWTWDTLTPPEDLILEGMTIGLNNVFADIPIAGISLPVEQFLGSVAQRVVLTFVADRDGVAYLDNIYRTSQDYARLYQDRKFTGYVRINEPLLRTFGIRACVIESFQAVTVPQLPDRFACELLLWAVNEDQKRLEELRGKRAIDAFQGKEALNFGRGDTLEAFAREAQAIHLFAEQDVYPDLRLPTYREVRQVADLIRADFLRKGKRFDYQLPAATSLSFADRKVDPDFYLAYRLEGVTLNLDVTTSAVPEIADVPAMVQVGENETAYASANAVPYANMPLNVTENISRRVLVEYLQSKLSRQTRPMAIPDATRLADAIISASRQAQLSVLFVTAIYGHESGWGTSSNARTKWNFVNIRAKNGWRDFRHFGSPERALAEQMVWIAQNYTRKGQDTLIRMVDKPGHRYCVVEGTDLPDWNWVKGIASIMAELAARAGLGNPAQKPISVSKAPKATVAAAPELKSHTATINLARAYQEETVLLQTNIPRHTSEQWLERMFHDEARYGLRGRFVRAFPSYFFVVVDEGEAVGGRRLWDNYYTSHVLLDITISHSRFSPPGIAEISLANIYGTLDYPEITYDPKVSWWRTIFPVVNDQMLENRRRLLKHAQVKPGARIHLRLGYGSRIETYPVVFNGTVTDCGAGPTFSLIAQSDEAELISPLSQWNDENVVNTNAPIQGIGTRPHILLRNLIGARPRTFNIGGQRWGSDNPYGAVHFGTTTAEGTSLLAKQNRSDPGKNLYPGEWNPKENPPDVFPFVDDDSGSDEHGIALQMYLYGKSIWDIGQVSAAVAPGYIFAVHYHDFHSTAFFGLPFWPVRYGYHLPPGSESAASLREKYKPFSQFHFALTGMELVAADLRAVAPEATVLSVSYQEGNSRKTETMYLDRSIRPDLQRTQYLDSTLIQDVGVARIFGHTIDVVPDALLYYAGFRQAKGWAKHTGRSALARYLSATYRGNITRLGDASIKPWDLIMLQESVKKLAGVVVADRVTHTLSLRTGFVTNIEPAMLSGVRDSQVWLNLMRLAADVAAFMSQTLVQAYFLTVGYSLMRGAQTAKAVISPAMAAAREAAAARAAPAVSRVMQVTKVSQAVDKALDVYAAGKAAWGTFRASQAAISALRVGQQLLNLTKASIVWGIISTILIDKLVTELIDYYEDDHSAIAIPLFYKGIPFVAGLDGQDGVVPGWSDQQMDQAAAIVTGGE